MNKRHALLIGAIAYPRAKLDNAVDHAGRVANALQASGFSVSIVLNPDLAAIDAALADFVPVAQTAELALVYLAGHAVERYGSGYFLPVDFDLPPTAARLRYTAASLNAFVEATNGAASRIIVLDACRNWPPDSEEAWLTSNDLDELVAAERDWPNLLLAYATSATMMAGDGANGAGSAFSASLCRHLLDSCTGRLWLARLTTKARRMPGVMPQSTKSSITSKRSRGCCRSIAATSLLP
jgi:uncharacterized caspase-like protein